MTREEYEFGKEEEQVFSVLSSRMKVVSVMLVLAGLLTLIQAYLSNFPLSTTMASVFWVILGIVFYLPLDNFKRITTTKGSDIKELMSAFRELKKGWLLALLILVGHRLVLLYFLVLRFI